LHGIRLPVSKQAETEGLFHRLTHKTTQTGILRPSSLRAIWQLAC
jgi:hypothetical protein